VNKEIALLLLRGWRDNRSIALIHASFSDCAEFICKGRVLKVSDSSFVVGDSATTLQIAVSSPAVSFKYAEPREFPDFDAGRMSEKELCSSSLVVTLGVLGRVILLVVPE
jgi:hypothetical protein